MRELGYFLINSLSQSTSLRVMDAKRTHFIASEMAFLPLWPAALASSRSQQQLQWGSKPDHANKVETHHHQTTQPSVGASR
ncbi:unnamed protein product [Protopolystoma xenopodis]|uniref:Uncharacterized protein n=1 Tax=Protopolystoma xenopodis TaxID=117903 RepID=A0A448XKH2_9PLAT|nr:unnamed protein product [Protopolystoma xenopodis]